MSAAIDQKAYLQKYLSGPSRDKKKKKKKVTKGKGFQIIDDDIDLSKLRPLDGDELDILDQGEDAPQIAGIIDERPEELKKLEQFKTGSKWRVVNQDDGFNSKLQVEEIKRDIKEKEKENELIFGKMYSDSEDEKKNDSDLSPPRKSNNNPESVKSKKHNSDSDFSPPRKSDQRTSEKPSKSDKRSKERVRKSRWGDRSPEQSTSTKKTSESPRRSRKDSSRRSESSDPSPPRKSKKNYDSDVSPPRRTKNMSSPSRRSKNSESSKKSKRNPDSDVSPPRKSKKYDSDASPPRRSKTDSKKRNRSPESVSPSKSRKSPQRRDNFNKHATKHKHRQSIDSDASPPRKNKRNKSTSPDRKSRRQSPQKNNKRKYNSDSDQSPPRKDRTSAKQRNNYSRNDDSPPPTNKKMARTLEGKVAGLQDARQLREENMEFRKKEEDVFKKMSDEVSGRNAQVVSRKSKRETSEDRQKQREKAQRQKELDEKYKKWSKGLKQIEDQESRVQEFLHEAAKPLARHKDDGDLEQSLRHVERAGDPMLKYIKEKKRERGELGPEKPSYKGSFPPNRFNIRPGYRWDGVDRSNGYEKKYFDQQSKRKAQEEEAYKWSTEDL